MVLGKFDEPRRRARCISACTGGRRRRRRARGGSVVVVTRVAVPKTSGAAAAIAARLEAPRLALVDPALFGASVVSGIVVTEAAAGGGGGYARFWSSVSFSRFFFSVVLIMPSTNLRVSV